MASGAVPVLRMNPWESRALDYEFPEPIVPEPERSVAAAQQWRNSQEPVIYPGLYSATGFDIMSILLQVVSRANPQIELGPIDCSVALILCDLEQPDQPIVYVSDSFCTMTGYSKQEVIGRNCRFLQKPHAQSRSSVQATDRAAISRMKTAIHTGNEIQLQLTNYKRSGQPFTNILSIIPLRLGATRHHFAVGFQVEVEVE